MAAFKLIAKRNICKKNSGDVVMCKGMSIEIMASGTNVDSCMVNKAIQQKYGIEVNVITVTQSFEIIKL